MPPRVPLRALALLLFASPAVALACSGQLHIEIEDAAVYTLDHAAIAAAQPGLADCAAFPALYYANRVEPLDAHPRASAYLERLLARPSAKRVLEEAGPYFKFFPE